MDRRLYLTEDWAADRQRRQQTHVPKEVVFQEKWRIALDLLDRSGPEVPHGWVVGDDEFGRATAFREGLRHRHERYVLDVPANTRVRQEGKGEVGLGHYEVRSWVGWHQSPLLHCRHCFHDAQMPWIFDSLYCRVNRHPAGRASRPLG
ncbi:MAG: transposase [Gemmataceae bacterium]|nr:transposase [Gemmataceae bacterium]